jgi:seryl-tRNA synthetase
MTQPALSIEVSHYHHFGDSAEILRLLRALIQKGDNIVATQAELQAQLNKVGDQLTKASGEIVAKIQVLTDAVAAAGNVTPEVQAAADALTTLGQALDDIVPDAVV